MGHLPDGRKCQERGGGLPCMGGRGGKDGGKDEVRVGAGEGGGETAGQQVSDPPTERVAAPRRWSDPGCALAARAFPS